MIDPYLSEWNRRAIESQCGLWHRPFATAEYRRLPRRIGIVGFSHYHDEGNDRESLSDDVIAQVRSGARYSFFTSIMHAFGGQDAGSFWADKLFFNVLPSSVGDSSAKFTAGSAAQRADVGPRFRAILDVYDPHALIVFTRKGWWMLPDSDEQLPDDPNVVWYKHKRGRTLVVGATHPMRTPRKALQRSVSKAIAHI